jgi:hypothetical protein
MSHRYSIWDWKWKGAEGMVERWGCCLLFYLAWDWEFDEFDRLREEGWWGLMFEREGGQCR